MTLGITAIYAAILAIMMIVLSSLVTMKRIKTHVSILDGGDMSLATRIRQHGNFIENVPMALIVMALAEANGIGSGWLHGAGILLVVSRVMQPLGLRHDKAETFPRIAGGMGTTIATLIPVVAILWTAFGGA